MKTPIRRSKAETDIEQFIYSWGVAKYSHIVELVSKYPENKLRRIIKGLRIEEHDGLYYPIHKRLPITDEKRILMFLDTMVNFLRDRVNFYLRADYPYVAIVRTVKGVLAYVTVVLEGEEEIISAVINNDPPDVLICILENPASMEKLKFKSETVKYITPDGRELN